MADLVREVQPNAFARNTAICPRVTAWSGQYEPAVPQPAVTPEAASASICAKNGWAVGTSLGKVAVAGAALT